MLPPQLSLTPLQASSLTNPISPRPSRFASSSKIYALRAQPHHTPRYRRSRSRRSGSGPGDQPADCIPLPPLRPLLVLKHKPRASRGFLYPLSLLTIPALLHLLHRDPSWNLQLELIVLQLLVQCQLRHFDLQGIFIDWPADINQRRELLNSEVLVLVVGRAGPQSARPGRRKCPVDTATCSPGLCG